MAKAIGGETSRPIAFFCLLDQWHLVVANGKLLHDDGLEEEKRGDSLYRGGRRVGFQACFCWVAIC